MTALMVFKKIKLLHCSYGRLVKGGEGTRYETRHRYAALFQLGSKSSAPEKKHEAELKSHLPKLLNSLRRFNLFQSQWIIFDQVKDWEA
jgi:hypothetical protein